MPDRITTTPEPHETSAGIYFEVHTGPPLRVTVAYRGDAKVWENGDLPNGLKTKITAALKAAVAAAKGEWGY